MNRELKNLEEWWPNVPKVPKTETKIFKKRGRKPKHILNSSDSSVLNKVDAFKSPIQISKFKFNIHSLQANIN